MSTMETIINSSTSTAADYVVSLIEEAGFTTEEAVSLIQRHAFDGVQDSVNNPVQS